MKREGQFRFVEHGLSSEKGVARWQDRLTPLHKRMAGGCHLNRKVDALLFRSGLRIESLEEFYAEGPRILTYTYLGTAVRSQ